jgi:inner membrane protein
MNGAAHRLVAGAAVGLYIGKKESEAGIATLRPVAGGVAATIFTGLPDLLEPAASPNHRQFFHSVAFAALLAGGLYKLHKWEPQDSAEKFWKAVGMLAISGYLIHLALDATTAKSLPLIGKF